jgi:hypothetical protein
MENDLQLQINSLKDKIPSKYWRHYHLEGIENFIFHLPNLKGDNLRIQMDQKIRAYLKVVELESENSEDIFTKARKLFPMVWEIADLYKHQLNFIKKPDYLIASVLLIPLYFILRIELSTFFSVLGLLIVAILYLLYGSFKIRSRKVY